MTFCLRNALLPTITVLAISFGRLVLGIARRDLPLIQAITMITVLGFASANLVVDLSYGILNPRIRLGE